MENEEKNECVPICRIMRCARFYSTFASVSWMSGARVIGSITPSTAVFAIEILVARQRIKSDIVVRGLDTYSLGTRQIHDQRARVFTPRAL